MCIDGVPIEMIGDVTWKKIFLNLSFSPFLFLSYFIDISLFNLPFARLRLINRNIIWRNFKEKKELGKMKTSDNFQSIIAVVNSSFVYPKKMLLY